MNNIKDFNNIIESKYNNVLNLEKYNLNNNNFTLYISIIEYKIKIKIITDFSLFCFIDYSDDKLDYFDYNKFNRKIMFTKKIPVNIINELINNIKKNNVIEKITFIDYYNIFRKSNEYIKYYINYEELINIFNNYNINLKNNNFNYKIPKELLLSNNQISKIIINEIKKINNNLNYEHYVVPDVNNPYSLSIRFKYNKNSNVYNLFQKLNELYKYDYIEIKLLLDNNLYPYVPPIIDYIKPNIKLPLLLSILNLDILKLNNWSLGINLEFLIKNLGDQLENLISNYIDYDNCINKLDYEIIKLNNYNNKINYTNLINIKYQSNNLNDDNNNNKSYFPNGTGYGSDKSVKWDINIYIKEQETIQSKVISSFKNIFNILIEFKQNNSLSSECINNSVLFDIINIDIKGLNIFELEKNINYYLEIFNILNFLIENNLNENNINLICSSIKILNDEIILLLDSSNLDNSNLKNINNIIKLYLEKEILINENTKINNNENYYDIMKNLQFNNYEIPTYHRFYRNINNISNAKTIMRILSEISSLKSSLPINWDSTIWIRYSKEHYNLISFIISGPKDTPYDNGLFEFHAYFPTNYPESVPEVLLHTTGNNTVRFNPNLYDSGKVCLSLLGTWKGQDGENWNPKTSTFLQVIISIQSLIFVEQPYFNEPGWEREIGTIKGDTNSKNYNINLYPHTIQLSMINMIKNPPSGFEEIIKNHFKLKKEEIIKNTEKWLTISNNNNILIEKRNQLIELLT